MFYFFDVLLCFSKCWDISTDGLEEHKSEKTSEPSSCHYSSKLSRTVEEVEEALEESNRKLVSVTQSMGENSARETIKRLRKVHDGSEEKLLSSFEEVMVKLSEIKSKIRTVMEMSTLQDDFKPRSGVIRGRISSLEAFDKWVKDRGVRNLSWNIQSQAVSSVVHRRFSKNSLF